MRMTLRISVSLPMTGSNFWFLAFSTSSWPYFSKVSYVASGLSLVTRWFPRTVDRAWRKRSLVMPYSFQIWAISRLGFLIMARKRCSTDTYSSPSCRASSSALTRTLFRSAPT